MGSSQVFHTVETPRISSDHNLRCAHLTITKDSP